MQDLMPEIHRQRLVIEGVPRQALTAQHITDYLHGLSEVLAMRALTAPVTHLSPTYGWAGWIHWETSGAHMYAWDVPQLFFSVDIYTCKPFVDQAALDYTAAVLQARVMVHGRLADIRPALQR